MRRFAWLLMSIGLTVSAVGCGDSSSNGSGGSSGSGGTAGTGGSAGTGGGNGTASVSGTVYRASLDGESTTLEGATVSVVGGESTTSGASGEFTLEAPVGITMFLTTAPDSWGELQTGDVPTGGATGAEVEVVPDSLVAAVAAALSETIDPAKGIVTVDFDGDFAAGGESADLGVDYGFALVFDADGNPELGNELAARADPIIIFANVDITSDVMPSASRSGVGDCTISYEGTSYPSQAKVFTVVEASCP
jgi:hypothetical protein